MRLALVTEAFPPLRISGAMQMRDLARELHAQGHAVTILVPDSDIEGAWSHEHDGGVEVVRLRAPKAKDMGYVRRTLAELAMPFAMLHNLRKSPFQGRAYDGVAWYSPSIFFGPFVAVLKRRSGCPGYLILRDIFPEWLVDLGIMRRGAAYQFFRLVARSQYALADVIGVQTPANLAYFADAIAAGKRVEVMQNWLHPHAQKPCSVDLREGKLKGRRVFVYTGNMGAAQGIGKLTGLARALVGDPTIGFAFVGRGSEAARLQRAAAELPNTVFHHEIPAEEMGGLYAQCDAGLVALDARHRWHNVPGKFISYMHAGLPVLASINPGNDMEEMIRDERVGVVSTEPDGADLPALAQALARAIEQDPDYPARCLQLAARRFSARTIAGQLAAGLKSSAGLPCEQDRGIE